MKHKIKCTPNENSRIQATNGTGSTKETEKSMKLYYEYLFDGNLYIFLFRPKQHQIEIFVLFVFVYLAGLFVWLTAAVRTFTIII